LQAQKDKDQAGLHGRAHDAGRPNQKSISNFARLMSVCFEVVEARRLDERIARDIKAGTLDRTAGEALLNMARVARARYEHFGAEVWIERSEFGDSTRNPRRLRPRVSPCASKARKRA
jgi:hypothetical protein